MGDFNRKKDKKRRENQELQKAKKDDAVLKTMIKHLNTDRNGDTK